MAIEVLIGIQRFRENHQIAHLMLIFEKSCKRFYCKNLVEVVSQSNIIKLLMLVSFDMYNLLPKFSNC